MCYNENTFEVIDMTLSTHTHEFNHIRINEYVLSNENGLVLTVLDYGASIFRVNYRNKTITLGPDKIEDFIKAPLSYGKTLGRHAGRILAEPFTVNNVRYLPTPPYLGKYQLHGGKDGFNHQIFTFDGSYITDDYILLSLLLHSPHLSGGYPGNLSLKVHYYLYKDNKIKIEYEADSDMDTYLNVTNHVYFNLSGHKQILNHKLQIPSNLYIDRTEDFEFLGLKKPEGYYDFNTIRPIKQKDLPFKGYDDAFYLTGGKVKLYSEDSSLFIEASSSYPVMVLYTHNLPSKLLPNYPENGLYAGVALEFQYAPNGIHNLKTPLPLLKKDERYHAFIQFEFNTTE